MTTLAEVRDFLKSFNLFSAYGIGRIDDAKKNVLGVFNLSTGDRNKCIGPQKCEVLPVSLLVHGDTNKDSTEQLANSLYEHLGSLIVGNNEYIGSKKLYYAELRQDRPVDVDAGDNKIYEYVIEVILYIEKEV